MCFVVVFFLLLLLLLQAVVASYDRVFPSVDEEAVGDVDDNCESAR